MKKLISACLALALTFAVSGCSKEKVSEEAIDAYITSSENLIKMKTADYSVDIDMEAEEEASSLRIYGSYNARTEAPNASMKIDMEAGGQKIKEFMALYLKEDMLYLNMMDLAKEKADITSLKAVLSHLSLSENSSEEKEKLKEKLKELLEEAELDGDTLTLVFQSKALNEAVQKAMKQELKKDAGEEAAGLAQSLSFGSLRVVSTLKENMLAKSVMEMTFHMTNDDALQTVNATITLEFNDINEDVQVDFPADLDTYVEQNDASQMTI